MIGTTPTHYFTIPISAEMVRNVEITYCQRGKIILQKYKDDCKINEDVISCDLTQEETFLFEDYANVKIQIRVLDVRGKVFKSRAYVVDVDECLSDEVLM